MDHFGPKFWENILSKMVKKNVSSSPQNRLLLDCFLQIDLMVL